MSLSQPLRVFSARVARLRKPLLMLITGLGVVISAQAQRETGDLSGSWKFIKQDVPVDAAFDSWTDVTVPHTWNAIDGQNGKAADPGQPAGYYRGPGWYARKMDIPAAWQGRRVFLRFEAASLVSDVYVNGKLLGQHRGGFEAFAYEITDLVKPGGENILRVKVDNTRFEDVIPLSGDFTVFGGIYRPVHLFSTDQACITPLYFGSSGVFLTQKLVTPEKAVVQVQTEISSTLPASTPLKVQVDLLDATQKVLQSIVADAKVKPGSPASVNQVLTIPNPHLWNGRIDPYMYEVQVKLLRDGKVVDEVSQPLGLRTVQITADQGFLLNGKPYPLHGVNRHQEVKDKGWAISNSDHDHDLQLILDMGATAVRLAHYPQSEYFLSICDKAGLILWQEIPVVQEIRPTKEFADNVQQQMKEMILQDYNHPAIAFWGIYNELNANWIHLDHPADAVPLLTSIRDMAHQLDPSRPVVAASWSAGPLPMHVVPDWQSLNTYPGWYWGKPEDFAKAVTQASGTYNRKRIGISEYGAGANIDQHMEGKITKPVATGNYHPEEYQTYAHEMLWKQMKDNPMLWGTFVWAMFDFASDGRNEGAQPGINDKGLVTHDHQTKKDAYYFYKANWNPEPMVFLAAKRNTPRKEAKTDIDVFTNTDGAELKVNGKSLGVVKPNDIHISHWPDVTLQSGLNKIEVVAHNGSKTLTDSAEWTVEK